MLSFLIVTRFYSGPQSSCSVLGWRHSSTWFNHRTEENLPKGRLGSSVMQTGSENIQCAWWLVPPTGKWERQQRETAGDKLDRRAGITDSSNSQRGNVSFYVNTAEHMWAPPHGMDLKQDRQLFSVSQQTPLHWYHYLVFPGTPYPLYSACTWVGDKDGNLYKESASWKGSIWKPENDLSSYFC